MKKLFLITAILLLLSWLPGFALNPLPEHELWVKTVDLNRFPQTITKPKAGTVTTIGDLHGNALKLIYFLIGQNTLVISKNDYARLVKIYHTPVDELTVSDLATFKQVIDQAEINQEPTLRFLGDDLCDRGMNDYFTLIVFAKLDRSHVPFNIVLSNHGNFFIKAYERPEQSFSYNPYGKGKNESTVRSMLNLGRLIDHKLVDKQEVLNIIQTQYLNHLVLPDFDVNEAQQQITLFTHAPVDLNLLKATAKDLGLRFQSHDVVALAKSLRSINEQIGTWLKQKTFSANYEALKNKHENEGTTSPLKQLLWNRDYTLLNRSSHPNKAPYRVIYVHGHDSMANVFDLDNQLGKGNSHDIGPYAVYIQHSDGALTA